MVNKVNSLFHMSWTSFSRWQIRSYYASKVLNNWFSVQAKYLSDNPEIHKSGRQFSLCWYARLSWHKPMQVSQEHGRKCSTADIPHIIGPFSSLGFLKFQLLVLHDAEQPVLQNSGNLLSLHYILCFYLYSKCSMHCLLRLVRQGSSLKVKLLLFTEWTKFNSWFILWQFAENLLDYMYLWAEDFEKCALFQCYRQ